MTSKTPQRIVVGLSGGVDSAVTALLLKQQGHDVHGVFMKNWEEDDDAAHCVAEQDLSDAQAVCARLEIPLHTVNFAQAYWDRVFQHFLDEYRAGRTPNPDVLCNTEIKFKAFRDYAFDLGADFMATGHYARVKRVGKTSQLFKAKDLNKDQSYFLHALDQSQLARAMFPLGELTKPEVRTLAKQHGLVNHNKKDSTGICFVGERKFKAFLNEYLLAEPGPMKTPEGETVGEHSGLMFYTLGQRQGLNIGGRSTGIEAPWYVIGKDQKTNVLLVAQGQDHPRLYTDSLHCSSPHWIEASPALPWQGAAKSRYRQPDQACTLQQTEENTFDVRFEQPQRAITPGQYVVFYDGECCLGGAIIQSSVQTETHPLEHFTERAFI